VTNNPLPEAHSQPLEGDRLEDYHTGGGCMAWHLTEPDAPGLFALVTDEGGTHMPTEPDTENLIIGICDVEREDPLLVLETDGRVGLSRYYVQNVGHDPDKEPDGPRPTLPKIAKQGVLGEAIAAFYDALINPDRTFDQEIEELISRRPIGVLDLGGKTADVVVISEYARSVYPHRSGTANIGVLNLIDTAVERSKAEFQLNANPPVAYIEEACRTKRYELFGEYKDVSEIVESACREYLAQVQNFLVSKIRDGSDLGVILLVGGGVALIRSGLGDGAFASLYKGRRIIAIDPEYANARGMWKYGMFVVSPTERSVPKNDTAKSSRPSSVALAP